MTRADSQSEAFAVAQQYLSTFKLGDDDLIALADAIYDGDRNYTHWAFKRKPGNRKWCPCSRGECVAIRELAKVVAPEVRPALQKYAASLK